MHHGKRPLHVADESPPAIDVRILLLQRGCRVEHQGVEAVVRRRDPGRQITAELSVGAIALHHDHLVTVCAQALPQPRHRVGALLMHQVDARPLEHQGHDHRGAQPATPADDDRHAAPEGGRLVDEVHEVVGARLREGGSDPGPSLGRRPGAGVGWAGEPAAKIDDTALDVVLGDLPSAQHLRGALGGVLGEGDG